MRVHVWSILTTAVHARYNRNAAICKGLGGLALDSSPMVVEWKVAPIGLPQQMMRA